ncbi:Gfo/Idh/MocA family oxidoreductase [Sphaerospermopsis aphanizomenoides BCCUSP55]|uniref:Gfo/Idh/MocA family protein n=1 Tax=Sphaerospermopsis aphanizomenoides TaxID=459663 RepID=UPI0019064847|nr:Gfo/Idh/MocA family oxidoreductase [Sphaerospermopsis aphanizomenoides]MBK1989170.1 Gfo/Idh/MocA family oxidoreductase [Sphaerospermopsis aphanizomenoides BCCUSP55]
MTKIQLAVIGVGRWGVHLLRNFLAHPQVIVVAVVDPELEKLNTVKQQFNLDENVLLTTDWESVKKISGLTAVAIATPATTHYDLIKDALQQGYHVLAEKPLTLDPEECRELCHLAEYQQLILMVDHTYLFHPAVEKGQTVVQAGQLGDLRYGYATRTHLGPVRQDVDALWDLAIHDIAIFNTWLGKLPVKVQATGTVWLQGNGEVGGNTIENPGLSDLVWVTLTYPDNFQVYVHLCWLNPDKQRRLGVVGSKGSLIFDEMSSTSPLTLIHGEFAKEGNLFIPINQRQEVLDIEKAEPLGKVCDRFVTCVINHTASLVSSGWVGRELVEILSALTTSLSQGGKLIKICNG